MEYAPSLTLQSPHNVALLQGIQYQALRIIFKAPINTSSKELHGKANLDTLAIRLEKLKNNYLKSALNTNNPLIELLNNQARFQ